MTQRKLLFIVNPRAGRSKSRSPLFDAISVFSGSRQTAVQKKFERADFLGRITVENAGKAWYNMVFKKEERRRADAVYRG